MKASGLILVGVGLIWVLFALNMDTTVETGGQRIGSGAYSLDIPRARVHNLGLMEERRNHLIMASVTVLVGVILFGFGSISGSARSGDTKRCPYCAELIQREARFCRYCRREITHVEATATGSGGLANNRVPRSPQSGENQCRICSDRFDTRIGARHHVRTAHGLEGDSVESAIFTI